MTQKDQYGPPLGIVKLNMQTYLYRYSHEDTAMKIQP